MGQFWPPSVNKITTTTTTTTTTTIGFDPTMLLMNNTLTSNGLLSL